MLIPSLYSHCFRCICFMFSRYPLLAWKFPVSFLPEKMQLLYKHMIFPITITIQVTHSLLHFPSIHSRTFPPSTGRNTMLHKKVLHSVEHGPYKFNLVYITLQTKNNQFIYTIQAFDHSSAHSSLT
jgi:hypothetical protein